MDSEMKMTIILLVAAALAVVGQPSAESDRDRFIRLNRAADQTLANYDLDKSEPLLKEALNAAASLEPSEQALAHARLFDLYVELHKRDSLNWRAIAMPH